MADEVANARDVGAYLRSGLKRLAERHAGSLCSGASSYVNGAEIHINGGQHV